MLTNSSGKQIPSFFTAHGVALTRKTWLEIHPPETDYEWWNDLGYRTLVKEAGDSPLGYEPIVESIQDDVPIWFQALSGTQQERETILLEEKRSEKHLERKNWCTNTQDSGFIFNGSLVESDDRSTRLILGALAGAQLAIGMGTQEALDAFSSSLGAGWRAVDGTIVAQTAEEIIHLYYALASHIATIDGISQHYKAVIDAATTIEELDLIEPSIQPQS